FRDEPAAPERREQGIDQPGDERDREDDQGETKARDYVEDEIGEDDRRDDGEPERPAQERSERGRGRGDLLAGAAPLPDGGREDVQQAADRGDGDEGEEQRPARVQLDLVAGVLG